MSKKMVIVTRSMFAGGSERVIAQLANYFVSKEIVKPGSAAVHE